MSPAVEHVYAAADLFALASKAHETWGLVVNEAMNFGLPVVASAAVGCSRDLVHGGVNGYVVSPSDYDAWANRLETLVVDAEARRRMGAASRELLLDWNYDRAAEGILAAVAALTQEPRVA